MGMGGLKLVWLSALLILSGCRENAGIKAGDEQEPGESYAAAQRPDDEVEQLRAEIGRLQGVIDNLQRELAEARAKMDLASAGLMNSPARAAVPDVKPADLLDLRVLEVNRDMKVSVINGGGQSGIRTGMNFHVLRDDRVIARLKIVEVRERIAGGLIEDADEERFPEEGDRVVLGTKQDG